MNDQKIIHIVESLVSEYSKRLTEREMTLKVRNWIMILKEITDEQGFNGLKKALENPGEFMPSVGKFKEMCLTTGAGCLSLKDEATSAWALVIQNLNCYSSPIFKDSAIAETIRKMGGWQNLCSMLKTDEPFRKKDFIDYYTVSRRQNKDFLPMLTGLFIDDYKFIGYSQEDDKQAVLLQIKQGKKVEKNFLTMIQEKRSDK